MKKIYAEIGLGNESFLSTEIEERNDEHRIRKFLIPKLITGFYLRIWVLKKELIISSKDGFVLRNRDKDRLKLLFGVDGIE